MVQGKTITMTVNGSWKMDGEFLLNRLFIMLMLCDSLRGIQSLRTAQDYPQLQAEDTFCGSLVYENGSHGSILAIAIRPKDRYARIVISATNGNYDWWSLYEYDGEIIDRRKSFTFNELNGIQKL